MSVRERKSAPWGPFAREATREVRVEVVATGKDEAVPPGARADGADSRHRARMAAIARARLDADAYAGALGLRTVRLTGISESGEGLFPRIRRALDRSLPSGLRSAAADPARKPAEATVVAEFLLAP